MKRPMQALAQALVVAASLLCSTATATTFHTRSPEQLALAADLIFLGTVSSVSTSMLDDQPWTAVTFTVDAWVAEGGVPTSAREQGSAEEPPLSVTLSFLGGSVPGARSLTVSGVPQLSQSQRVLVFAYDTPGLASPVVGVNQGLWTIDARGARGPQGRYLEATADGRLRESDAGSAVEEIVLTLQELLTSGRFVPQEPDSGSGTATGLEADPRPLAPDEPETSEEEVLGSEQQSAEAPGVDEQATEAPGSEEQRTEAPGADEQGQAQITAAQRALPGPEPLVVRYVVNESGGPLLLSDSVQRAAQVWSEAAQGSLEFMDVSDDSESAAGAHTVLYGSAQLFGPDALSFTLVHEGETTQVLVSPRSTDLLVAVLVHELGVLIGLPEEGSGVMAHGVTADQRPAASDLLLLEQLRTFRPEDLNRDGTVDFYDLAVLAQAFGSRGVNLAADLNNDGVVNEADVALLEAAYQFLPPSESPPGQD